MLKKFGKMLTNNLGLKMLAVFFAVALWMVVVSINDPTVRKSATISVTLKNQNYITSQDKYSDILNMNNTVTFYYSTPKSTYDNLSTSDFSATADMEKIEYNAGDGTYRVPVVVAATRYANKITIESKQLYLEVPLEDLSRRQFSIKANTTGTVADGCALGDVVVGNPNVIKISGPVSVVGLIDTVSATINVEGMSDDITDNVVPVCYDTDGNIVDTTKLTMSLNTVSISAQILSTKDVELEFLTMGTVAEGYRLKELSHNPTRVRVKGEAAILNKLDQITIPAEVLDLTDATETIEKKIDISSYLPVGVSLVISSDAKIDVTVEIEPIETRVFKIPVKNLTPMELRDGYKIKYTESYIEISITAGKSELELLKEDKITGTIDTVNLGEGEYEKKVELELDPEIYTVEEKVIKFTLENQGTGADESENSGESQNTDDAQNAGESENTSAD